MSATGPAPTGANQPTEVLVRLDGAAPVVELADVARSFHGPPEVLAVRGVTLTVGRGDYVSVTGPSGSGKSTLLNLLGLLDRPTVGRYRLNGQDTASLGDKARTRLRGRQLGFVFQAFHLLAGRTVLENVLLGMTYSGVPKPQRAGRAAEALERVGMTHRAGFFPATLSGGERQRTAVARAVASRPSMLLADEPTGNLDQKNSQSVLDVLEELNRDGLTVVVVTHEPGIAARCRRRLTMSDGLVTEGAW
ncbi:MAG: ABC transporter ATP-binding protein [Bifidobacteriaceae bacterium]|jgi:putative ABC transport system ATP-binding protein|nr:ABC transporter ATP-binding protein [Bifidobacteriaceae bacterium]